MPLLVSWSSDSAGVMYRARPPVGRHRRIPQGTISSCAFTPGTQGSGREVSVSHTEAVPAGYGPVGSGRYGVGPRPVGTSPASAEVPMPPIITTRPHQMARPVRTELIEVGIEAVEAEGFGGGGVVAAAFGEVQVAGIFAGRADGGQVDGPPPVVQLRRVYRG